MAEAPGVRKLLAEQEGLQSLAAAGASADAAGRRREQGCSSLVQVLVQDAVEVAGDEAAPLGGRRSAPASAMRKARLLSCSHGAYTEATMYCEPYRQQSTLMQRPAGSALLRCETSVHGSLDVKKKCGDAAARRGAMRPKAGPRQAAAGPAPSNNHR